MEWLWSGCGVVEGVNVNVYVILPGLCTNFCSFSSSFSSSSLLLVQPPLYIFTGTFSTIVYRTSEILTYLFNSKELSSSFARKNLFQTQTAPSIAFLSQQSESNCRELTRLLTQGKCAPHKRHKRRRRTNRLLVSS